MTKPPRFEDLFREHFPRLVSLGASMTGRIDIGNDLAQETMVRAHDQWDTVSGYDVPFAWMRRVLVNLAIDHQRKVSTKRAAVARLAGATQLVAPPPELDQWSELVADLTEKQRVIATLYYADDLTVADIADIVGIAEGTVKATLAAVRDRLRRQLTDPTPGEEPS